MANKKENFTLGAGCISCAHNKDINLYKDMFKKSTERNEDNAEEGKDFFKNLINNPPKRTRCRFYNSEDGLLCEYFVERDYVKTEDCPDYTEVKFEKAAVTRTKVTAEEIEASSEDSGEIREVEVEDEENTEAVEFEDEGNYNEDEE